MVDDRSDERVPDNPRHRMWTPKTNRIGWQAYLGTADPEVAVPARHADLSAVAPAWVGVGTIDPLYDEDVEYARRLVDAGVDVLKDVLNRRSVPRAAPGVARIYVLQVERTATPVAIS
jgi:acetyl esterase/lipase